MSRVCPPSRSRAGVRHGGEPRGERPHAWPEGRGPARQPGGGGGGGPRRLLPRPSYNRFVPAPAAPRPTAPGMRGCPGSPGRLLPAALRAVRRCRRGAQVMGTPRLGETRASAGPWGAAGVCGASGRAGWSRGGRRAPPLAGPLPPPGPAVRREASRGCPGPGCRCVGRLGQVGGPKGALQGRPRRPGFRERSWLRICRRPRVPAEVAESLAVPIDVCPSVPSVSTPRVPPGVPCACLVAPSGHPVVSRCQCPLWHTAVGT